MKVISILESILKPLEKRLIELDFRENQQLLLEKKIRKVYCDNPKQNRICHHQQKLFPIKHIVFTAERSRKEKKNLFENIHKGLDITAILEKLKKTQQGYKSIRKWSD